jgi:4-amino-4-deoxy-L-arabinose transferase-like glycosyltransferase
VREPVWSLLDEGSHWAIGHSLATDGTLPQPQLPPAIPTDLPRWRVADNGLEGYQPPLNYLVFATADILGQRAARPLAGGNADLAGVYAMRLTNAIGLAMIAALLYLAARRLAPGNIAVAWAMPGSLLLWRGVIFDAIRVGNDILPALFATLAIYLTLRWSDRLDLRRGLAVGGVVGLATLSKYTGAFALVAVVMIVLASRWRDRRSRAGWLDAGGFVAAALVVTIALLVPWLVAQHHLRGCYTCAAQVRSYLPPALRMERPTLARLAGYARSEFLALANGVDGGSTSNQLGRLFPGIVAAAWAGGVLVLGLRRARLAISGAVQLAMVAAIPAQYAFLLVLSLSSGNDLMPTARYVLPVVLPAAFLAGSAVAPLGGRLRWAAGALVMAGVLALAGHELHLALTEWPNRLIPIG